MNANFNKLKSYIVFLLWFFKSSYKSESVYISIPHSLSLYEKEQREHSAKRLFFWVPQKNESPTASFTHEDE